MHFCLFSEFFPFLLKSKISDLNFFYFVSPSSCVIQLTVLKFVVHIYAQLNILIFPWLSKLFPHRRQCCDLFSFFFLLNGAKHRILNSNNNK